MLLPLTTKLHKAAKKKQKLGQAYRLYLSEYPKTLSMYILQAVGGQWKIVGGECISISDWVSLIRWRDI